MSVRSWVLALSVAALAAVPAGTAAGVTPPAATAPAGAWGPVKTLAANPRGESLAVDAGSNVTVVWATSSAHRRVMALRRPAGGGWGTPVVIGHGIDPQVAADDAGNVTAVWLGQRPGFTDKVMTARRPAGGDWSEPVRISGRIAVPGYVPGGGEVSGADHVALDVSPAGAVVVAWDWAVPQLDQPSRILSNYQPAGGAWGGLRSVTGATGANTPLVGIAGDGTVVLLYGRQAFGHPQVLRARQRSVATGNWSRATTVAAEGYAPRLAVDGAGAAVVVFTPNFNRVRVVEMTAAGHWGRSGVLSPRGVEIRGYDLAMNGPGVAVVAFARERGRVDVLRRPAPGQWGSPRRVVRAGTTVFDVLVGIDDAGDTFLGWGGYALLGSYRPHGEGWGAPVTISPDSGVEVLEETSAAVAPDGDVAVLWEQEARPLKVRLMTAS